MRVLEQQPRILPNWLVGVLSSLLPGFRQVRVPLVAGYLWLVALWLFLGDEIPDREQASGLLARLYELGEDLPDVWVLVGLSFVAYLLGSLSELGSELLLSRFQKTSPTWRNAVKEHESYLEHKLKRMLIEHGHPEWDSQGTLATGWELEVIAAGNPDVEKLRTRLMANPTGLYGEYDRLRSEADFGAGIALPLAVDFVALAQTSTLWWLLGISVSLLIFGRALQRQGQSVQVLVTALTAGNIHSPVVESMNEEIEDAERAWRLEGGGGKTR